MRLAVLSAEGRECLAVTMLVDNSANMTGPRLERAKVAAGGMTRLYEALVVALRRFARAPHSGTDEYRNRRRPVFRRCPDDCAIRAIDKGPERVYRPIRSIERR